jgi:imidazolonepropionase-like amidohydrolase
MINQRSISLGLLSVAGVSAPLRATPAEEALAVTHVTLIDVSNGRLRENVTVLMRGGRIAEVGRSAGVRVPQGAQVIDGRGKFLIPGLWNMHVHSVSQEEARRAFPKLLAQGVTGIRDMGAPPDDVLRLRRETRDGVTVGPHMMVAGPLLEGPLPPKLAAMPMLRAVNTAGDAAGTVRNLKQAGVDYIKVDGSLPRDTYFAVAAAAKRQRIPFAGHVPPWIGAAEASDAGQRSVEHLGGPHYAVLLGCSTRETDLGAELAAIMRREIEAVFEGKDPEPGELRAAVTREVLESYSEPKAAALFARFRGNGTWQVPTLKAIRGLWNRTDLSAEDRAFGEKMKQKELDVVAAMSRADVRILAGTDGPLPDAGPALHEELALLVKAGLTPLGALQAATRNPAEFMGKLDRYGSIEAGKAADLVLLRGDPLAHIDNTRSVEATVLGGRLVRRPTSTP